MYKIIALIGGFGIGYIVNHEMLFLRSHLGWSIWIVAPIGIFSVLLLGAMVLSLPYYLEDYFAFREFYKREKFEKQGRRN